MAIFDKLVGMAGKAIDYATPGSGSNRFTDYRTTQNFNRNMERDIYSQDPKAVRTTLAGVQYNYAGDPIGRDPNYKPPSAAPSTSTTDSMLSSLQAELRALRNSQPYTPSLPKFDIVGNYNRAKSQAEAQVNPLYEKKLTDFLGSLTTKKQNKLQSATLERNDVAAQLQELLQSNVLNRDRTTQDTNLAIDQINTNESQFQTDEGQTNEAERQGLIQDIASAGLTTSGLGQQRVADQQRVRNVVSERQLTAFNQDRDARELYRSRTFEDLANSDTLGTAQAARKNESINLDLDSYMDDLAYEEQVFRLGNELDRFGSVLSATDSNRQTGVEEFIASLINSGRRPEDIELARSIYA